MVPAALAEERADEGAVGMDWERDDASRGRPLGEAEDLVDTLGQPRKPRLSTASARLGRAIST